MRKHEKIRQSNLAKTFSDEFVPTETGIARRKAGTMRQVMLYLRKKEDR